MSNFEAHKDVVWQRLDLTSADFKESNLEMRERESNERDEKVWKVVEVLLEICQIFKCLMRTGGVLKTFHC